MKKSSGIFCVLLITAYCCYGLEARAAQEKTFEGSWKSSKYPASGAFSVKLKLDGNKITGNIEVSGSPMINGGKIKGSIQKNKFQFGVITGGRVKLRYQGTIAGDKIGGTYTATSNRFNDKGSWSGTKQSAEQSAKQKSTASPTGTSWKCYQSTGMTYYFKGDRIRFEKPGMIPGVVTYDLQIGDTEYYKVVVKGEVHAAKIKPTMTFDKWYKKIVITAERAKNTPAANMPGVIKCEKADLPDKLFEVPK